MKIHLFILSLYYVAAASALVYFAPSCQSLTDFSKSPQGKSVIHMAGALAVEQALTKQPHIEPALSALADSLDGTAVDVTAFEDRYLALATQIVGSITTSYGDEATAKLVSNAVRAGISIYHATNPDPSNK